MSNLGKKKPATKPDDTKPKMFTPPKDDDLNADQMRDIKDAFNMCDKSKSGTISMNDLDGVFRVLGFLPTPLEIQEVKKALEREGKKSIDFDRLVQIMKGKMVERETEKDLAQAFKYLDVDKSGQIESREFLFVMNNITSDFSDAEVAEMIKQADVNGDGNISEKEFIRVMKAKKGKNTFRGELLIEMKKAIKQYVGKLDIQRKFKKLKPHLIGMMSAISQANENMKDYPNRKQIMVEHLDDKKAQSMYSELWDVLSFLLKRQEEIEKKKKQLNRQQNALNKTYRAL
mmetsp:Transcript_33677/g.52020  ORF Transcript_33677/g.52020 Transcript_33677/m.52020 type:complete len:287 (-) Transcript_33677:1469-2329(-)